MLIGILVLSMLIALIAIYKHDRGDMPLFKALTLALVWPYTLWSYWRLKKDCRDGKCGNCNCKIGKPET